jgi:hypothetical protein
MEGAQVAPFQLKSRRHFRAAARRVQKFIALKFTLSGEWS